MSQKLQQQLKELGSKLESPPASSKDALVKLLKQSAACLTELDQSPPKPVADSMQPFVNAIAKPEFLKHQDREVKLLVASCICEITRITAPEPPYDDDILKDIFELIVSTFSGLSDVNGPSFGRRVVILENVARYRSCVVMLDLECDDLINEMFNTFFVVVRDEHPGNVSTSMQTIMEVLFDECEDIPESLLLVLLSNLGGDKEDITMAARRLAMNVIENCAAKLEPGIKQFLVSSMTGDNRPLKPKINYHAVMYDIYRCAPQILSGVVPYLTGELLSDQLEIRLKAVSLVGDLFALPGSTIPEAFKPVFLEFLKRLTDRVAKIRTSVLEHVKICLLENPFRGEARQIISALCDRLLDYDENVRKQVVAVVCDVACHALTSIPVETIKMVSERLRDKSLLVKRYTMERLADIYRIYCTKISSDSTKDDGYDWIVGKILRCFYDKDFRSDTMEPILSLSLFPADFSIKDKSKKWVRIFSVFDKVEVKAFEKILEQKQRLQQEMHKYLSLRHSSKEGDDTEVQKKVMFCFRVMSCYFGDPAKAEENFQILDQLKDGNVWRILTRLIDPNTCALQASSLREDLLKILGQKHQLYDFLSTLSLKCSYLLFDKDHIREFLLDARVQKCSGSTELILSCMAILVMLARFCPLLLGGIEEDLVLLLEDDNDVIKEGTLHILARAGGTIRENLGVSSRSLDLVLERISIEGSRRQAKYAVHALASITKDDGLKSLSVLYKRLVAMLGEKSHLPSVLQSLGCIAQAAIPVFETRESEIQKFIKENILELGHKSGDKENAGWDDRSEHCSLKIFGLKALVKSYLPVKDAHLRSGIDDIIGIIKKILFFGDISKEIESSLVDRAHLKLAAAKAVLRLSKHWEHKIPVDVLYLTLSTSEENFPEVKKLLLSKVYQYVRGRILDSKYACAFLLDVSSSQSDFPENKHYLNDIIQICRQGKGRQVSLQSDATSPSFYPEYILPYVVHSLSHHASFPNIDECKDVKSFEPMYICIVFEITFGSYLSAKSNKCPNLHVPIVRGSKLQHELVLALNTGELLMKQLYLFLSVLIHGDADSKSDANISKDKESIQLLNSIFQSIRRSEDAFDPAKSKNSYALCDVGVRIMKRLAPNQDELHSSAPVALPLVLYKPLEKKEENDSLVGEQKTWLADDYILAHFESLGLEANGIVPIQVHPVVSEDDVMKDSETEGSEMTLGKLLERLKAKAAKTKKEAPAKAETTNGNDFDILKMVKEINSDNQGNTSKLESSNGHKHARNKMFSEATDVPVPKRRRTSSSQAHKSTPEVTSKGSKRDTNVNSENSNADFDEMDKEPETSSEEIHMLKKASKVPESELLFLRIRKKLSSSKQNGKRSADRDHDEALSNPKEAKKPKKVSNTDNPRSVSNSKSGSLKKQKLKSFGGLAKCKTKENGSSTEDLIDCRIKVWWPMDKEYYEGVVKSFDSEKNKHVILYDDGDVEVLRLDKEHWELVGKDLKVKRRSGSSKGLSRKGGSSGKGKKTSRGPKQDKDLDKSSSHVRGKRTTRKNQKQKPKKLKISSPEFDPMSSSDFSDSEKVQNKRTYKTKELSGEDNKLDKYVDKDSSDAYESNKLDEDVEDSSNEDEPNKPDKDAENDSMDMDGPKGDEYDFEDTESENLGGGELSDKENKRDKDIDSSDADEPKGEEIDSEDIESGDLGQSLHGACGSDDEAVSSSDDDEQHLSVNRDESGHKADESDNMDKVDKETDSSDYVDAEFSDDEPLGCVEAALEEKTQKIVIIRRL
ncbi:hypothetical protein CASFOL_031673 [Castilleja foliolosa]|uniref:Uncharacterized protein n=1 Tax=Castilleja foliolosa TaxID=1961234 RepID=A0ABD3C5C3_9LAMI